MEDGDPSALHQYSTDFFESLSDDERALFQVTKVATELVSEVTEADRRHMDKSELRARAEKALPFIAGIEQYGKCMDVFANSSDVLSPIWGGIRVILHVSSFFPLWPRMLS